MDSNCDKMDLLCTRICFNLVLFWQVVQEIPEETCFLEPQRECKFVTKLVPQLKPTENCIDIPKEVCSRLRKNPRKVSKPIVKRWCYTPTKESGLPPPPPRYMVLVSSNVNLCFSSVLWTAIIRSVQKLVFFLDVLYDASIR